MNCREREVLLGAYVDGELELSASLELEAHVATCTGCATRVEGLRELSRTIRSRATRHTPSAEFIDECRASLRLSPLPAKGSNAPPARASIAARWCIAAAAIVLAWLGGMWWSRPSTELNLGEEVVAAHVRSLQAEHLTDVASTDRHTVNPWFQGKLTFAVRAEDYAAQGFVLVGGRLDYVGGSNAAAFVYKHGPHVVNVFEWPADVDASANPTRIAVHGYAVEHWIAGGVNIWVVSDADPSTVTALADLLRHSGS
jgi:anti-sigma factor RsiW